MPTGAPATAKASSLRWKILRQALLRKPTDEQSAIGVQRITRKTTKGFNLIPSNAVEENPTDLTDLTVSYTLPIVSAPKLYITQRVVDRAELSDFEICNQYNIDNTGLVCQWPSEEALAYFCLQNADKFRSKRVIELGAGYGLAGLVIAAVTDASEVVITDGNPQVVDYIQRNIDANTKAFGDTRVKSMMLHWNQNEKSNISSNFDLIIASDCTFFKEFHNGLAQLVKFLLEKVRPSEAIFFSPKRGNSLDKFLEIIKESNLSFSITENYDAEIWKRHNELMNAAYFRQYGLRLCGIKFHWLICTVACVLCTDSFREIGIAMYGLNWYCCPQLVDPKNTGTNKPFLQNEKEIHILADAHSFYKDESISFALSLCCGFVDRFYLRPRKKPAELPHVSLQFWRQSRGR